MVCERDPDSPNDPTEGRIELVRDGDWLTADGTTLGADDGVAIAAMMALVEDDSLPHGPLQLLMTVAEEVGLEGANGLDGSLLHGKMLVNLDSEEDGALTVGCAGSTDTWIRVDAPRARRSAGCGPFDRHGRAAGSAATRAPTSTSAARTRSRCSAARCARRTRRRRSAWSRWTGGKSRNAIPRDALAVCVVAAAREERLREAVDTGGGDDRATLREDRRRRAVTVERRRRAADALDGRGDASLLDAIALVPTGPLAMSPDFDGLVETSTSLGEATTDGETLTLHSLSRSSNDSALPEVLGDARRRGAPRRRQPRGQAQLRRLASEPRLARARRARSASYERAFGEKPIVTAVHAGLETAVVGDKVYRPRHDLVRAADRGAAFAGRARQHPDRGALLAAARRRSSTSSRSRADRDEGWALVGPAIVAGVVV